ncbi:olfactory receptor 52K2-like [Mixophyes fleayi]|uniref:olfactory receptor 52K2-like n=1 Tax=Mixophyes fleayi TaxID=3061075 RepID=UPI003F4DD68B
MANYSQDFYFELIGFPGVSQKFHILVSLAMFIVYSLSLIANGAVILLILVRDHLHQPMYIIIGNLALSDLLFDTFTLPKIIAKYWFEAGEMSSVECFLQMYFIHYLGTMDSFILMLMAGDRYVAICKPLRYPSIITHKVTIATCLFSWLLAASIALVNPFLVAYLPFQRQNKIISCFCSTSSLLRLARVDVTSTRQSLLVVALCVLLIPLFFIILSYIIIIKSIHLSGHADSWQRAFYTCTTHLFVISLYFIPRVSVYIVNYTQLILNPDVNVLILCLYSYFPHVANPIIYCLRTEEIKCSIGNIFKRRIGFTV